MVEAKKDTVDIFCERCNVQVEAEVVARHVQASPMYSASDDELVDTPHDVYVYSLAECRRCRAVFLTRMDYYEIPGEVSAPQGDLATLYPKPRSFDESQLPAVVLRPYKSASRAYQAGLYEPCVIMCRKCLEAICHEHGISGDNLKKRLNALHTKGVIDGKLLDWATGLRLVANDAAHELGLVISKIDAEDSIEFVEALFLYLFSLDRRFREFKKRREEHKRSATTEDNGQ